MILTKSIIDLLFSKTWKKYEMNIVNYKSAICFRIATEPNGASDWSVQFRDDNWSNQHQDFRRHHELPGVRVSGNFNDIIFRIDLKGGGGNEVENGWWEGRLRI